MNIRLNDKVYDFLKWLCLIVLPACACLYMAVANIWHLGYIQEVVGTIEAIECFIGALIGLSDPNKNNK